MACHSVNRLVCISAKLLESMTQKLRRTLWTVAFGFIATALVARPVAGQSLADVARKEQERRKAAANAAKADKDKDKDNAKKVYTNKDLGPGGQEAGPAPSEAEASAQGAPAAPGTHTHEAPPAQAPASAPDAAAPAEGETRDENWWRNRITTARADLQRQTLFLEAIQSRVNALTTDFVNRDDPAQRDQIAVERQKNLAELERVQKDIERLKKQIADIQEEARKAGVPAGWLR
jgi:hypothetical protein